MKNIYTDPNQEVEAWKDTYYQEFRKISKTDLANYLEKEADQILKKYNIKPPFIKLIKKIELTAA
jgi:hypothetical protein